MTDATMPASLPGVVPPDDPGRRLAHVRPDDPSLPHLGIVGDTYTVLLTGEQTGGRYCLIDMHVPPEGGPPPHRHDFEEMFSVLDGEIEVTFRGQTVTARAGETVNIPANAPHSFKNTADLPARLLCVCAPPGQEAFFEQIGVPVDGRTASPPKPSPEQQAAFQKNAEALAPRYRTELLKP